MKAERFISGPIFDIRTKNQVLGKFYMITYSIEDYIEVNCMFN
jgi:hypothetical protein